MSYIDSYAVIASKVFKNSYWDNMEFHEDGTFNIEGKNRCRLAKIVNKDVKIP